MLPEDLEPVTEEEYLEALRIAEVIVQWAERVTKLST